MGRGKASNEFLEMKITICEMKNTLDRITIDTVGKKDEWTWKHNNRIIQNEHQR